MKTAAIVIIGNEILSGRTRDTNSSFLATELRELGVEVRRISVIPDDVDVIAEEVAELSALHDFVFTSGGIGPTHDDMTMQGVAKAFGLRTVTDNAILDLMRARCKGNLSKVSLKMAELPEGARVLEVDDMNFPPVVVENVYIFPGIPELLTRKFSAIKERFRSDPFVIKKIYLNTEECLIADHLNEVEVGFQSVAVGSYPYIENPEYNVVVTLESTDTEELERALQALMGKLPSDAVVRQE